MGSCISILFFFFIISLYVILGRTCCIAIQVAFNKQTELLCQGLGRPERATLTLAQQQSLYLGVISPLCKPVCLEAWAVCFRGKNRWIPPPSPTLLQSLQVSEAGKERMPWLRARLTLLPLSLPLSQGCPI